MPIYEYVCRQCDREFDELIRNPRDEAALRCSACGSAEIERKLSVPAAPQVAAGRSSLPTGGCGQCGMAEPGSCPFNPS